MKKGVGKVNVDFDKAGQMPLSFAFAGKTHRIGEVLGRFKTRETSSANAFLVCSEGEEVYFLYFHTCVMNQHSPIHEGYWVLCFRILTDGELMALYREDRKMLVNMMLKKIVDFHGHLCPDLVLGGKACQYVQKLFTSKSGLDPGISIIAENCTSALDAIQIMLGATVGNQRLQVMDFGKHNYTFIGKNGQTGLKLSLRPQFYGDEEKYNGLEQRIMNNQVMLEDVVQFQGLLDSRVKRLFSLSPEDLFDVDPIEPRQKPTELASVYLTCCSCGEHVLKSRIIEHNERRCYGFYRKSENPDRALDQTQRGPFAGIRALDHEVESVGKDERARYIREMTALIAASNESLGVALRFLCKNQHVEYT